MAKTHRVSRVIGPVLRALREERSLSQEKLAFKADLERTYIGMIEREERHPTVNTLGSIIDALGISWTDLGQALDKAQRPRRRVKP